MLDTNICFLSTLFVENSKGARRQFPVAQAAATTVHKCQGSALESVCTDMDVSPSEKSPKNPEKPKHFINMCIMLLQVVLGH